ncbi:MAG: transketolase C-terminal domain-containing protein [bacterium]|nr:transketolase C-terminal domain-containing protein [bacterium]
MSTNNITISEAIKEVLHDEMRKDSRLFIMGEDIGKWGGRDGITKGFIDEFGEERIRETPINEELFVGIALGAAQAGLRPIVEFAHGTLITIAASDIFLSGIWSMMCTRTTMPSTIIRVRWGGGKVGGQLSIPFISQFFNFLGVVIISPSTVQQAQGLLRTAFTSTGKVIIFLEHWGLYKKLGQPTDADYKYPSGKAEYRRTGKDVTIITHAQMTDMAESAADELKTQGVDVEILDLVSLKPLDTEKIKETSRKTKRLLIADEEPLAGGGLYPIIENIARSSCPDIKIIKLGAANVPIPYGFGKYALPQKEDFIREILNLMTSTNN